MPTPGRLTPSALLLALVVAPVGPRSCGDSPPRAPALDPGFDGAGYVHAGQGRSGLHLDVLAELPDGQLVLGGNTFGYLGNGTLLARRHLADGSPDPSFHEGGPAEWDPCQCTHFRGGLRGLRRQRDGTLLFAGSAAVRPAPGQPRRESLVLLRYRDDGTLFAAPDVIDLGAELHVGAVAFPPAEDDVFAAGQRDGRLVVTKLHGRALDPSFAAPDLGALDAGALALDAQGRLLVAGWRDQGADRDRLVARLLPTGALDPSFASAGLLHHARAGQQEARGLAVLPDGRVLVAADSDEPDAHRALLLRLSPDGALDPTFGDGGVALARVGAADPWNHHALSLATMSDGRILVASNDMRGDAVRPLIARFLPDGALDPSFGDGGAASFAIRKGPDWKPSKGDSEAIEVQSIAVTRDGKLVVAGTWSAYPFQGFVARLTL
jgi:uncharacterized delta-60 repeat protein